MSNVVVFKGKRREEMMVRGTERVSYSYDDILLEHFFEDEGHPYAIYDRKGNLLETNIKTNGKPFWYLYTEIIGSANAVINEFGVDV